MARFGKNVGGQAGKAAMHSSFDTTLLQDLSYVRTTMDGAGSARGTYARRGSAFALIAGTIGFFLVDEKSDT